MWNKKWVLCLILSFVLILTGCGAVGEKSAASATPVGDVSAEENASDAADADALPLSDENLSQTVTVKATASGEVKEVWLKQSGDDMEEAVDAAELPFAVHITYTLDGEEITPEELAGKSGHLVIRFDYENLTAVTVDVDGQSVETQVPFILLSAVVLPEDRFSNITVSQGGVTELSDNKLAYGYALPGLQGLLGTQALEDQLEAVLDKFDEDREKDTDDADEMEDFVEIEADTVNCKIEFTATLVSNGFFADSDAKDFDDLTELTDRLAEFADDGDEMMDGLDELKDGVKELGDGLKEYTDAASDLADGASALSSGAAALKDNGSALTSGAEQLSSGLSALNNALAGLDLSGLSGLSGEGATGLDLDVEQIATSAAAAGYEGAYAALAANETLSEEEKQQIAQAAGAAAAMQALTSVQTALETAMSGSEAAMTETMASLSEALASLEQLKSSVSALASGASQLSSGVSAYVDGASKLADGAATLADGAKKYASAGEDLNEGYGKLSDGIDELVDGLSEMNEKMFQNIGSLSEGALPDTIVKLKALRLADLGHTAWNQYHGSEGDIRYIVETDEIKK